ncbi:asparaginase domain-containing protein, partial [Acidovorax sp. 24-64-9]|uniref:asparaginase domain-containing protein n=1 Tax=Acidovorax sp. 24-64-9 TaxID=1970309 RepID=UPI0025C188D8
MQVRGQKIVVLGTGGTIAGTAAAADDNIGYTAAQVGVEQLLHAVPGLQAASGGSLVAEQIAQLDSKDMEFSVWGALAQRCASTLADPDVRGVVITHGTDTLEETAWFLQSVLDAHKPVVLTRVDGHASIANQKALDLAGIKAGQTIVGGSIDVKNGRLTG